MKLSTKGRYGTRALIELAMHQGEGPVLLKEISQRQDIPVKYLGHLITQLISGGLVRSARGAKGGVWLTRDPAAIKLSEVIQILEGSIAPVDCIMNPDICQRADACATRDVWTEINDAMNKILESTTIQDLVDRQKLKDKAQASSYQI